MTQEQRAHDIVVFGATGFVGKLLAAYLANNAPTGTRIALGGRSREKLEKTRADLPAAAKDWPLVTADSSDDDALRAMARDARVIATTVGPYRKYGLPLVDACIAEGTDYCDLTGEVLFVHETKQRHDEAEKSGAKIVHSVGFDSIPSDIGVYLVHEKAREDGTGELTDTKLVVTAMKGGASGGTIASMKGMIDEAKTDQQARRAIGDPYALCPDRSAEPHGKDESDRRGVSKDDDLGQWVGPFVMAQYNTRIVRRSNSLLGHAYGRDFRYQEVTGLGTGPLAPAKGAALAAGLGALAGGLALPPTRMVLDKVLPGPGEGPSEDTRNKGFFKIKLHARTSNGAKYVARVEAQGDPGYKATALMMGQSALCLALDGDKLPDRAGILTPATAMDGALVERLRAAGMTLSVERDDA
jgi:short subunit dehydrogenase-like uncharacterized protein